MKSIVTEYDTICFFCGGPRECEHHLIFGNGRRQLSDDDGLIIYPCHKHHNMGKTLERIHDNPSAEKLSKMLGQAIWERNYVAGGHTLEEASAAFFNRYKINYL